MATSKSDLLQGTLDLLILRTLSLGPLHGYGISQRLEQLTRGVFHVNAGTFFPALYRLEEQGLLAARWGRSENNRRARFYSLTRAGGETAGRRDPELGDGRDSHRARAAGHRGLR